jgi:eukaryotic-like serine/threonine-protein kinase
MSELELFAAAIAIADPAERAALLDRECAGKPELRSRLDELLAAHCRSNTLLDQPRDESTIDPENAVAPDPVASADREGTVIAGRYKLLQQIGEGGMGTVWMADQTEPVKRRVAVKLIRDERGQSKRILARFEAERQAIALMGHPHIARLLDAGTADSGVPFFVMELVKGVPLTEFCDTHKLGIPERLQLFMKICSAVQHAHQKGIIHRDLKPSNILIESHDGKPVPKIIDFGLAKATSGLQLTENTLFTAFGSVMGTPLYMAPEQATFNAVDVDTRADIYALGIILYELLTGTTPITRATLKKAALDEMLRLIREQEVPTPSSRLSSAEIAPSVAANRQTEPAKLGRYVKGELDWIVLKSLAKERDRRYETANGFAKDIERFLNHEPVTAGPPSATYRLRKFVRRNRMQVVAATLVLLALIAGVIGTSLGMVQAFHAAEAERIAKDDALEQKRLAEKAADNERQAKLEAEAKRQEAVRNLAFAKKGNEILGSIFAGLDPKKIADSGRPLQDVMRENLRTAIKELEGSAIGDPLEVAAMQVTLGNSLFGLGEYPLSVEVLEKAQRTYRAKLSPDHLDRLTSMSSLARSYVAVGRADLAVPLFEETLERRKAKLGPDHRSTLISMNNLAFGYQSAGKLDLAIPLYEETLKLLKAKLGPDDPTTLQNMNNLAFSYQAAGKLDLAITLYGEALKLQWAKLGPEHVDTAHTMNNLAMAYSAAGNHTSALPLYVETLKLYKARLGFDHPTTLTIMNNMALCCVAMGRRDLAAPIFEGAFKYRKAKLGPEHPDTLLSMSNLARAYAATGKRDLALPLYVEMLKLQRTTLGPGHRDTLLTMNDLAVAYKLSGKFALALPLFEETLKLQTATLGPNHVDTLTSLNNLAMTYQADGQLDRAVPLLEQSQERMKATFGADHLNTLSAMASLGKAYADLGQGEKAAALFNRVVDAQRRLMPKKGPGFAVVVSNLGMILLECGQQAAAEPLLRECLTLRQKSQPEDWTTFYTQSMLGGALSAQKKFAEAEPLLVKGYEGLKAREASLPKTASTRIPEALDRLVAFYAATNKPDETKMWRAERAKYPQAEVKTPEKK